LNEKFSGFNFFQGFICNNSEFSASLQTSRKGRSPSSSVYLPGVLKSNILKLVAVWRKEIEILFNGRKKS